MDGYERVSIPFFLFLAPPFPVFPLLLYALVLMCLTALTFSGFTRSPVDRPYDRASDRVKAVCTTHRLDRIGSASIIFGKGVLFWLFHLFFERKTYLGEDSLQVLATTVHSFCSRQAMYEYKGTLLQCCY